MKSVLLHHHHQVVGLGRRLPSATTRRRGATSRLLETLTIPFPNYATATSTSSSLPAIRRRTIQSMAATHQESSPLTNSSDAAAAASAFQLIQSHQEKAARLPPIQEVKTLLHHSTRGILSTFSQKYQGYPSASMVDFASDAYGSPILALSDLAVHSKDLLANSKCSLLVAKDPEDRTDLVITVHGDALPVTGSDIEAVRAAYLTRHPDAFWVDFGDFKFLRIEPKVVRYVSGVATALLGSGEFSNEEFREAKVDPIYQFSKPIISHMNKDHGDDTKLIVQHSVSLPILSARACETSTGNQLPNPEQKHQLQMTHAHSRNSRKAARVKPD